MKTSFFRMAACAAALFLSFPLFAGGKLTFRSLSFADGLPHSDVNDIVQDERGYMWFATYGGLCKWDGYRMTIFTTSNSQIGKERILSLCAASDSLLYVGTESGGLNIYDDRRRRFIPVRYATPLTDDVVHKIFENPDGSIYLCHNHLLSTVQWEDGEPIVRSTYRLPHRNAELTCAVGLDPDHVLAASGEDLYLIDIHTAEAEVFPSGCGRVGDLVRGRNGEIFVCSFAGIQLFDAASHTLSPVSEHGGKTLLADENLDLWVGTEGEGLYKLDGKTYEVLEHHVSEPFRTDLLSSQEICTLYLDNSGVLWVGTIGGGINTADLCRNNIHLYTTSEGLGSDRIITFGEDAVGDYLYVSSHDGGVDVMDMDAGVFSPLTINGRPSRDFPVVSAFHVDDDGAMWLGTWGNGIWTIAESEIRKLYAGEYGVSAKHLDYVPDKSVYKIEKDAAGRLWISTNAGLLRYDPETHGVQEYRHDSGNYNTLSSDFVTDLCAVSAADYDMIFVGTRLGLDQVIFDGAEIVRWRRLDLDGTGIGAAHFVSCIHRDRQGVIWVATLGGGLYRLETLPDSEDAPRFVRIEPASGSFVTNELESMLEDEAGNLWIGGYGITRYSPRANMVEIFTDKDNLQSSSFKIWAARRVKDGRLVFGGINGFNIFRPEEIVSSEYIPRTVISSVKVNGDPVSEDACRNLDHKQNSLQATFSSTAYNNPKYNVYKYRLEGFEDAWHLVSGTDPGAVYSNLPAGKYTLVVYGTNRDGRWGEVPARLRMQIRPHPLLSPWAFFLYLLLLVVVAYSVKELILWRINEKNERRIEQDKLRFFTDIAHEIKTPLTLISSPVEEILSNPSIGTSTRNRLQIVDKSVTTLKSLVEQILDLQKYEANMMRLSVSETDLCGFLKELAELFMPLAAHRKIRFRTEIPDTPLPVWIDKGKMERVVVNLLSNAFKFTEEGGEIVLSCGGDAKSVFFCVKDSGKGIRAADKERIFDRFYQAGNWTGGTGIGLSLSRHIVEHHKGEIRVESELNQGSKFSVELPRGRNHFDATEIDEAPSDSDDLGNYDPIDLLVPEDDTDREFLKEATVLVVDDNKDLRNYLADALRTRYNVLTAETGMRAYEIAIAEQPDLILSDVMMPEMSGIELCRRIKNNEATSHILVILLTARNLVSTEIEIWQVGADGFITKPFHLGVLMSRVSNLIVSRDKLRKVFKSTIEVNPSEITMVTADEKLLQRCLEVIEARMGDENFGVDALCREVGVSRAQLYRKITSLTGLSAIHFIRSIRLKRAAQMLSKDNSSVSEVMYKVGFSNASYFSKIFKEEFGCLPKEYGSRRDC